MVYICVKDKEFLPEKQTDWAFAYDLKSREDVVIKPWEVCVVKTWVKVRLPKWIWMLVYTRSSLPIKKKLIMANWVWVIDSDYRWEVWLILMNISKEDVSIQAWERLWQCVFQREIGNLFCCCVKTEVISEEDFDNFDKLFPTDRWEWWYWSTWQ